MVCSVGLSLRPATSQSEAILTHCGLILGVSEAVYQIESSFPMTMYPRAHVSRSRCLCFPHIWLRFQPIYQEESRECVSHKTSPFHMEKQARSVRVMLWICHSACSFCPFSRDLKEHEANHFAVNLHMSSAVSRFRSRIPRSEPVDFYPSVQISTLQCKTCPPFSEFTSSVSRD